MNIRKTLFLVGFLNIGMLCAMNTPKLSWVKIMQDKTKTEDQKIDELNQLFKEGLSVNAKSESFPNFTPLMLAAERGYLKMVNMLLGKGADVSAVDFNKAPALFYAARWGQLEIVRLLLTKDTKAVTAVSKNGNNILLDMLLYYGQNLKETDNKIQFKKNLVDIARLLIDRGANVNAKARPDEGGVTPIMKAASYDNFELVKLFKEKGADLCLKDQFGTGLVDY